MLVYFRTHLDFLYNLILLFLACVLVPLLLLETVLAVIHYAADRRSGLGSNLDKIKLGRFGHGYCLFCTDNTAFRILFVDKKYLCSPNIMIYARFFFLVVCYGVTPPDIFSYKNGMMQCMHHPIEISFRVGLTT